MNLVLLMIIVFLVAFFIYHQTGKYDFLHFDLIQFLYAFVLAPISFILLKTIFYKLLENPALTSLESGDKFILDTVFSTLYLFVYTGIVLHSFTKSLQLKKTRDPLFDIFHQTEFFHKWATHLIFFPGLLSLFGLIALSNAFLPLNLHPFPGQAIGAVVIGSVGGLLVYFAIERGIRFSLKMSRIMKLFYGLVFVVFAAVYFLASPNFNGQHALFWFAHSLFGTLVVSAYFLDRIPRLEHFFDRFRRPQN